MNTCPPGFEVLFTTTRYTCYCPKCGSGATGVEVKDIYDGVCYFRCEKCKVKWHRFGLDQPHQRAAVERYWEGRL